MTSDPQRKGTGGHGRRRLQGKGPTPPAHMRPGHPAARRAAGRKRAAGTRDDTAQSTEAASGGGVGSGSRYGQAKVVPGAGRGSADGPEVVAGRNAVVESLRAAAPATALYLAGRMDTDERVTEAVRLAGDAGVAVLEASRAELDRLTGVGGGHRGSLEDLGGRAGAPAGRAGSQPRTGARGLQAGRVVHRGAGRRRPHRRRGSRARE